MVGRRRLKKKRLSKAAAAGGVFRGMGRQKTVAARNFLGFWVFGMPVGATLTFACGVGLAGLWWGLTVGLTVVTLVSLCQLAFVDWERETRDAAAEALRVPRDIRRLERRHAGQPLLQVAAMDWPHVGLRRRRAGGH